MKNRIATTALAALIAAGSLTTGVASAQTRDVRRAERNVRQERQDVRQERRELRDARQDLRQERQQARWNDRQYNGYYFNGRFYYGQPNAAQMQRRDYRPAWQQWRRGDRLTSYGRQHYREVDWRRERLRQPPRGYHYVRDDRGEVLLVGIATGVILSILLGNN
jgi:Ni/Co efflux regulator RcnB